jgi:threonine/homoserine/homoserine lactone efflux protein
MRALIEGMLLGLTLAFFIGPAFFALIQTSIHRGLKSGLLLAIGIFFSDLALLIFCIFGFSRIITDEQNALYFGLVGGIMLITFGIVTFQRKSHMDNGEVQQIKKPGPMTYILKGFFMNFANPFIWFFWMGIVALVTSNYVDSPRHVYIFFAGSLFTVLTTDFIKCFISHKIKRHLNNLILSRLNHIVGIVLTVFGIVLIVRVFLQFTGIS